MKRHYHIPINEIRLRTQIRHLLCESSLQQMDEEYMQAVKAGDMEKVLQMVKEAFKIAFPNTKAIDGNGEPMIMHHGTNSKPFNVFKHDEAVPSNGLADIGFWFSPVQGFGKHFARRSARSGKPRTMSVFLNIEKPKVYDNADKKLAKEAEQNATEAWQNAKDFCQKTLNRARSVRNGSSILYWLAQKDLDKWIYYQNGFDAYTRHDYEKASQEEKDFLNALAMEIRQMTEKAEATIRFYYENYAYGDSFEQFQTDIYRYAGQTAKDANFGRIGKALNNPKESKAAYLKDLIDKGHDGILIRQTTFDAISAGGNNDQYVVFNANQIKLADPVVYDDEGNIIPLSQRFTQSEDIRYEEE